MHVYLCHREFPYFTAKVSSSKKKSEYNIGKQNYWKRTNLKNEHKKKSRPQTLIVRESKENTEYETNNNRKENSQLQGPSV